MTMSDDEFRVRAAILVANTRAERAAERQMLTECDQAVRDVIASGEPLTEAATTD